ncbi:metallophosphoesterase [Fervidicella metallireducens AeB]|uniref:Metallophosphoesterase n=1 Tax=Fervidicella metallireducens AeB TaxID=1403537 RepID=A0A017RXH0_9CLOT|nr:bifunctional UDP-sugar hydrolase/5'-nucleotidase [Fervidicella metallireducens]EYE89468.1 metallophosphoesterase [Fervidicella metallireducens AeB]
MRRFLRMLSLFVVVVLIFSFSGPLAKSNQKGKSLTILFTHDLHDHFLPFNLLNQGQIINVGGYPRLQSAIDAERKIDKDLLLVDAGDFSMGTLFQTIFSSDAPQLRILGEMGYDVVTLGNHEFDFRADGLAESLKNAKRSTGRLPQIVSSNITFPKDKNGYISESLVNLKKSMEEYGVKEYTILEKNGVKIGIFGLIGKDSADCAPMAGVEFEDVQERAKSMVKTLKEKEKVELIICLSHSGTSNKKSESEDEILARKVPGIDIIISGHTHTKLEKPIVVGKTIIASCGEYSENLGVIRLSQTEKKEWNLDDYRLRQIDETLSENQHISEMVNSYKEIVQKKYLDNFNMGFDEILAYSSFNFTPISEIGLKHQEEPLGNLISDAYIYAVEKAEGTEYEPVTAAIVPCGTVRNSFVKGQISVSDAFNTCSLGIGKDKIPGYPLVSVYLTGKELKTACEVDASITPLMPSAQLYMSGLSYTFNPKRFIFNKVTDAVIKKKDGSVEQIDDEKLYRVVANLYSGQMLSVVGEKSKGILSIIPKTKEGKAVIDFEKQIIYDKGSGKPIELKEWLAVAEYLKSFEKKNGISQIPEYYNGTQGRKVINNNSNIFSLLSKPNKITLTALAVLLIILFILIFVISMIIKRKKHKERVNSIKG